MKMAKLQKATLDPTKISGRCGRLKCCLRYEYDTYEELQKDLPPIGSDIVTNNGRARVLAQEILAEQLLVADGRQPPRADRRERRADRDQAGNGAQVEERKNRRAKEPKASFSSLRFWFSRFFWSIAVAQVKKTKTQEIPPLVKLVCEDRRFKLEAYQFVGEGLRYAQEILGYGGEGEEVELDVQGQPGVKRRLRHVSGRDLCFALRRLAHDQYGYMARLVLESWGIKSTGDFGEIVYNLIKIKEMSKSDGDRREDFDNVYDFEQGLMREYAITRPEE